MVKALNIFVTVLVIGNAFFCGFNIATFAVFHSELSLVSSCFSGAVAIVSAASNCWAWYASGFTAAMRELRKR